MENKLQEEEKTSKTPKNIISTDLSIKIELLIAKHLEAIQLQNGGTKTVHPGMGFLMWQKPHEP